MLSEIRKKAEFDEALQSAGGKLVVVDFSAIWCGPCRMIAPFFEELSNKYPDVVFLKVDVDDAADVARSFDIVSLPTFHFYLNGKKVDEFSGARKDLLEEKVKSNMP